MTEAFQDGCQVVARKFASHQTTRQQKWAVRDSNSSKNAGNLSELPAALPLALLSTLDTDEQSTQLLSAWATLDATQRGEVLAMIKGYLSRQVT